MTKLAILNNLITPYRVPLYKYLGTQFETSLLLSGKEANRDTWNTMGEDMSDVEVIRVWGFTLHFFEKRKGNKFDPRYLHINPGYFWELIKICPDALISSEMGFRSLVALLYGFLFKKPVWILWGGTMLTEKKRGLIKKLVRQVIFKRVSNWISYGETTTEYLVKELRIDRSHILQIQNCIDETQFTNPQVVPLIKLSPSPVLLYTGQFIRRKGVDLFLNAAAKVQQQGYKFSILMVGSGIEKELLMTLATDLVLENITVLPSQPPAAMPAVYKSADVLVFPTREEVWGLVVNEALWSGIPVISSMYAGCAPEIVPDENIFNPLDSDSFEDALIRAITGKFALPNVECLYTSTQIAECIVKHIRSTLSSKQNILESENQMSVL